MEAEPCFAGAALAGSIPAPEHLPPEHFIVNSPERMFFDA
jgi:hypothetical protein